MATNSVQSIHHHHCLLMRNCIDSPPAALSSCSLFLKPTTTISSLSHSLTSTTFSLSSSVFSTTTTTPSTTQTDPLSFDLLRHHLSTQNFRQADEETRRLLIVLAGEQAQKRGYVFFSEVQFIPQTELKTIDSLWKSNSNNRFGYSVQRKIWKKVNRDFTSFFMKVGWMKKLETEVVQYNYRAFPNEFVWELSEETPVGHLPLTNALRGTQLLNSILSHPAFDDANEDGEEETENNVEDKSGNSVGSRGVLSKGVFKPDYSF